MWIPYVVTAAALTLVALAGMKATVIGPWYRELKKPSWNPPDWAFGVIWTIIYGFIIASIGIAWNAASEQQQQILFWVTLVNFVLNSLWSFMFFKWRLLGWALVEMTALWLSIVVMMMAVFPYSHLSGWLLFPYLTWVTIAFLLNMSIYLKNPAERGAA